MEDQSKILVQKTVKSLNAHLGDREGSGNTGPSLSRMLGTDKMLGVNSLLITDKFFEDNDMLEEDDVNANAVPSLFEIN